jgi:hypothetical protein
MTNGPGRPQHEVTDALRDKVKTLAAVGTRHEDIALVIGISADTLVKHYRQELDEGRIHANAAVAQTLYNQAKSGNTTAMIFWLKSRARWKETTAHEISGADGSPLTINVMSGVDD